MLFIHGSCSELWCVLIQNELSMEEFAATEQLDFSIGRLHYTYTNEYLLCVAPRPNCCCCVLVLCE